MSEPEIKFELNDEGRIEYRITNNGVLLSEEEAEQARRIATAMYERITELEQLVRDMYKELANADGVFLMGYIEKRIRELGIEVNR